MSTSKTKQEIPMKVEPRSEHEWLQKLIGKWTVEGEMTLEPGKKPEKFKGTETVRPLGKLWILAECEGECPISGPSNMLLTLGYDTQRRRFVGTFVCSDMTHLWEYHGRLDKTGNILELETAGPNLAAGGAIGRFKDSMEIKSHDHRILTSRVEGDDGEWHTLMKIDFRRAK